MIGGDHVGVTREPSNKHCTYNINSNANTAKILIQNNVYYERGGRETVTISTSRPSY
jgi:hypothetical protein